MKFITTGSIALCMFSLVGQLCHAQATLTAFAVIYNPPNGRTTEGYIGSTLLTAVHSVHSAVIAGGNANTTYTLYPTLTCGVIGATGNAVNDSGYWTITTNADGVGSESGEMFSSSNSGLVQSGTTNYDAYETTTVPAGTGFSSGFGSGDNAFYITGIPDPGAGN